MAKYQNKISERVLFKIWLRDCIKVLQEHLVPDGISNNKALGRLYGILDNKLIVNTLEQSDYRDRFDIDAFLEWREKEKENE